MKFFRVQVRVKEFLSLKFGKNERVSECEFEPLRVVRQFAFLSLHFLQVLSVFFIKFC